MQALIGFGRGSASLEPAIDQAPCIHDNLERLVWLYHRLADDHSRQVLVETLRARALGGAYLAPPADVERYWQRQQSVQRGLYAERADSRRPLSGLHHYAVHGPNGPISVHGTDRTVLHTFLLERCAYVHDGTTLRVQPGDVVLDGGSGWGDTALYFADRVGSGGRVHAIELSAGNTAIIAQNLKENPHLLDRVTIIEAALSSRSGNQVSYEAHGPMTMPVRMDQWGRLLINAITITLDDIVERQAIQRVDHLQLDVGGTERQAITGARRTIQQHRPTVAVALYHALDDVVTIPALLDEFVADFDFFLDDVTINGGGTMLFARPRPGAPEGCNRDQPIGPDNHDRMIDRDAGRQQYWAG